MPKNLLIESGILRDIRMMDIGAHGDRKKRVISLSVHDVGDKILLTASGIFKTALL